MVNINSITDKITYPLSVALRNIWYADVDDSYNINRGKNAYNFSLYTAVRTVKGQGKMCTSDGKEYDLRSDSLLLIKSETISKYYCKDNKWEFYWFEFNTDLNYFETMCGLYEIKIDENEIADMKKMFGLLSDNSVSSSMEASTIFSLSICKWLKESANKNDLKEDKIQSAIKHINMNFAKDISIDELSKICGMSERSFRNHFKNAVGVSPKCYIESKRMETAKYLLVGTTLKIGVISRYIGFENQFYFCKCFKNKYGISPSDYREEKS